MPCHFIIAVECGDPGKPTNGEQIVKKGYVYGGSVKFVCDKNYTLVGTDVVYCQANRSWSSPVPRCLGTPYRPAKNNKKINRTFKICMDSCLNALVICLDKFVLVLISILPVNSIKVFFINYAHVQVTQVSILKTKASSVSFPFFRSKIKSKLVDILLDRIILIVADY